MAKKKESAAKAKGSNGCKKYPFSGKLWCDDHTDVYVGTKNHLIQQIAVQNHPKTIKLSGEAKCCDYIYFVCWSNDSGENGLIAELVGGNNVRTGDTNNWEVFATKIDKDQAFTRPTPSQVNNQILLANNTTWLNPFVGPGNSATNDPFSFVVPGINSSAKFIWHNSKKDSNATWPASPFVPFKGFNHDEFLIFRFPASKMFIEVCQECDCCEETPLCSSVCAADMIIQESELTRLKNEKEFDVSGRGNGRNCAGIISGEPCRSLELPKIRPCFYFHWGDSPSDQIETHDTEVVYITVCNPYNNIGFKGLTILNIEILPLHPPLPTGEPVIRITPSKLICFNCLDACSCSSREFALISRGAKAQQYTINVEYCIEEIVLKNQNKGVTSFPIKLIKS